MATRHLNIRKPETLLARIGELEQEAIEEAKGAAPQERIQKTLRINGSEVSFTVTPSIKPGRIYRLFHINGERTAKGDVPRKLLARSR